MGLKSRLKTALNNLDRLNGAQQWYFVYIILSYALLLTCFGTDYWSTGQTSRQGLWNYCTFNDTVTCCGKLDSVIGYKAYIGATRAFIIIEMIAQLSVIISFLMCIVGGLDRGDAGWLAILSTLISIPLMVIALSFYGVFHDNYSYSEAFKLSLSFWVCMTLFLVRITSMCIFAPCGLTKDWD